MPRKTRATAKAEITSEHAPILQLHEVPSPVEQKHDREPLRSITPNSVHSEEPEQVRYEQMPMKKAKAKKKANGGKKNKKFKADADEQLGPEREAQELDENEEGTGAGSTPQVVEVAAAERILNASTSIESEELSAAPIHPLRRSRRNRPEDGHDLYNEQPSPITPTINDRESETEKVLPDNARDTAKSNLLVRDNESERISASVPPAEETMKPEQDMGTPAEDMPIPPDSSPDLTDASQVNTPSQRSLPVLSPAISALSSHARDPIEAMDALEDEIEEVKKILPVLEGAPLSPTKSLSRDSPSTNVDAPKKSIEKRPENTSATKNTSAKTSINRSSSVRGGTSSKLAATTESSATNRAHSMRTVARQSVSNPTGTSTFMRPTAARLRPSSIVIAKDSDATLEGRHTDYLASKRRPISLQFPTPPPPPKSSKPPTRPKFTLPGDAIAARLKAAREERQKKEEEESLKRREFKARTVPSHVRGNSSTSVKQTATSRARMSIMGGDKENTATRKTADKGLKRASTVTGAITTCTKRQSLLIKKDLENNSKPVQPSAVQNRAGTSMNPRSGASRNSSLSIPKRQPFDTSSAPATGAATTKRLSSLRTFTGPKPRATSTNSSSSQPGPVKSTMTTTDMTTQRHKGREIFNRDRLEKEARDRDRRDKEDKARKAREQAAERSRQLSREFREKQRRKAEAGGKVKSMASLAVPVDGGAAAVESA